MRRREGELVYFLRRVDFFLGAGAGILSTCPTSMRVCEADIPLAACRAAIVTPWLRAILPRLSPLRTLYVVGRAGAAAFEVAGFDDAVAVLAVLRVWSVTFAEAVVMSAVAATLLVVVAVSAAVARDDVRAMSLEPSTGSRSMVSITSFLPAFTLLERMLFQRFMSDALTPYFLAMLRRFSPLPTVCVLRTMRVATVVPSASVVVVTPGSTYVRRA